MGNAKPKIWLTSDTHFCHNRGFVYEPRGFTSIDEMCEAIVERWNSVVGPDDIVYHLGDVMLNDNDRGMEYLKRLNGKIYIIRGNHDTNTRINLYNEAPNVFDCGDYARVIKYGKYQFYLSHYPTMTSNLENSAHISEHMVNLYGHTHQKGNFYEDIPFMYHVGMDSHDCYPVDLETIIEDIKEEVKACYAQL